MYMFSYAIFYIYLFVFTRYYLCKVCKVRGRNLSLSLSSLFFPLYLSFLYRLYIQWNYGTEPWLWKFHRAAILSLRIVPWCHCSDTHTEKYKKTRCSRTLFDVSMLKAQSRISLPLSLSRFKVIIWNIFRILDG